MRYRPCTRMRPKSEQTCSAALLAMVLFAGCQLDQQGILDPPFAMDAAGDVALDGENVDGGGADAPQAFDADAADALSADAADAPYSCADGSVSDCRFCDSGISLCAATHTCVAQCLEQCDGGPIACFACDPAGARPASTCEPLGNGSACIVAPLARCSCDAGVSDCPGSRQVCVLNRCVTCGEDGNPGSTNYQFCKGPPASARCDTTGGYTCHL